VPVKEGLDPNKLEESGWGVIFPTEPASKGSFGQAEQIREALQPLLALRQQQAGELFRTFEYRPGETKSAFLARQGMGPGPVDPRRVPYYLLLVGDPVQIPFRFQSQLDVQYAVGRIHFDTMQEFDRYARTVVAAETGRAWPQTHSFAFFGASHPDDPVMGPVTSTLFEGLVGALDSSSVARVQRLVGPDATKARLVALLSGPDAPAVLFTSGHSVIDDPGRGGSAYQGALLCSDWPGPRQWRGAIRPDFFFSAEDVPERADLSGKIAFLRASCSAGQDGDVSARFDQGQPQKQAPARFPESLASLPLRLLSNPGGGMLGVVGWIDRLWGGPWLAGNMGDSLALYQAVLLALLQGRPLGYALEHFNERYAELATQLADDLEEISFGKKIDDAALVGRWIQNQEARNCILLGDPAVRLSFAPDESASSQTSSVAAATSRPSTS
jgi:hypothetical protein